jgi:hypothetical protein
MSTLSDTARTDNDRRRHSALRANAGVRLAVEPRRATSPANRAALAWLVQSDEPAIRYMARRDLLREVAAEDQALILQGPIVRALLDGQQPDGGFGSHPYAKWHGAHWRLVSLIELAIPRGEPRALAAAETVLQWLTGAAHRRSVPVINGLARRCASQEGNALAVCCRLGLADDPRARLLASSLVEWQRPDGGWNCDRLADGHRSSFHETLPPMWGLHEFATATGDQDARRAADRAAELLLEHRLFRSMSSGDPIHRSWVTIHWPPYWHYDVLQALVILARMNRVNDSRADDAVALLQEKRRSDGRWRVGGRWWRGPGSRGAQEVVDWSRGAADRMVTLNALRVLGARGASFG